MTGAAWPVHEPVMLAYKILRGPEYAAFRSRGETAGSPADLADGFIHLSTGPQVATTLARHFAGEQGLWLLAVPTRGLDALRWELSRRGELFPHLYRALRAGDVLWARPIPPGGPRPEDLA